MIKSKLPVLFIIILSFMFPAVLALIYTRHNNTLFLSNNWDSTKVSLPYRSPGAQAFILDRKALSDNSIDLGTWHGYQEVVSKEAFDAESVEFQFLLPKGKYLSFHYNRNFDYFDGIVISANQYTYSKSFRASSSGEFISTNKLPDLDLYEDAWNLAYIKFGKENAQLYINGKFVSSLPSTAVGPQKIGFRGPEKTGSKIDSIVVRLRDNRVWTETFDNRKMYGPALIKFILLSLVPFSILSFLRRRSNSFLFEACGFLLVINLTSLILLAADFFVSKHFYFSETTSLDYFQNTTAPEFWTGHPGRPEQVVEEFKKIYFSEEHQKKFKILLFGSSQTWGAGASSTAATVGGHLNRIIRNSPFQETANVFTFAVSGFRLLDLRALFYETIGTEYPDLVVINLGVNDSNDREAFQKNLSSFVKELKEKKIKVILSAEPFFGDNREHKQNNISRLVADETETTFIDAGDYIDSKRNSGYLCWDFVHFSDYGQQQLAEQFYETVKFFIPVKKKSLMAQN